MVHEIRQRLAEVHEEIADTATRTGRDPREIRLVAVTKTLPAEIVQAAVSAGVTEVGENYLQEAADKYEALGWPEASAGTAPVVRHAIGHIQSNKANMAVRWCEVIETVDSLGLAMRLDRLAGELGRRLTVLLQVNISGEDTKSGMMPDSVAGILSDLAKLAHIQVAGFMTIGRFEPDPEAARSDFRALRQLRDALHPTVPPEIRLHDLSMGMSHDFPVAIEEGATIVRVGTRLFGER